MRLLSKTTLLIVTVSIFIFLIGNIVFFHISKAMIKKHIDTELVSQMHRVLSKINKSEELFQLTQFSDEVVIKVMPASYVQHPQFSDTVLYDKIQKRYVPHRSLKFTYKSVNVNRKISIYKSLLSSDKLIERITISSIVMVMIFVLMIYILNRFVFRNVWSNFFSSLKKIENYDIKSLEKLKLEETEIDEFDKLNKVLTKLVNRIQSDYQSLKELTANTSHEIQTPLAIIRNKAEMLLQSDNLSEKEMQEVYSILTTSDRLSKLNQSLLLITKIENNLFDEFEEIHVNEILEKHLNNFAMLFEAGEFKVSSELTEGSISINPILLDILVSNLMKNAVAHGTKEGNIHVAYHHPMLQIKNDGERLPFPEEHIFTRFVRGTNGSTSNGLGLEIVSKICNYYSITINYSFKEKQHCFAIDFSNISL
ncbi:MAG: HAMP domain-containing histidine kinase [Salinivirgaceae bacterium]|nr:HAMP domain-containing histidine kinase [Salinivirgaceae bacterium]